MIKGIDELCGMLARYAEEYLYYKKIVIAGGGFWGRMACEELCGGRGTDVLAVCDNDASKHTEHYFWVESKERWIACRPFFVPETCEDDVLYVIAMNDYHHFDEIRKQLEDMGVHRYISYENYSRCFYNAQITKAYHRLQRQESKETFCGLLQAGIEHKDIYYQMIYRNNQYFALPEFEVIDARETFFEAGAYVGEVLEEYIWRRKGVFHKIYAFEPGKRQFEAMKCRMERIEREWAFPKGKINLVQAALGADKGIARCVEGENLSCTMIERKSMLKNDKDIVEVDCIDSYYKDEKVSLVIADIEGYEENLILGMKKVMKRDKPKMAISAYHRPNDIWRLMELICSINGDYKFDMLHHSSNGREETVLYCQ